MDEIILGVDPGLKTAGYSVIASKNGRTGVLDIGFLSQKSSESVMARVGKFYAFMLEKTLEHNVTTIALETPFLGKNAQTFLKLGYLRGMLYLIANQHNLRLKEFAPREVKLAVTGFGAAKKDQVSRALHSMFPALVDFKCAVRDDVTDALGVGLCGVWKLRQDEILSRAV